MDYGFEHSAGFARTMFKNGGDGREIFPVPAVHVARSMEENPKMYKRLSGILSALHVCWWPLASSGCSR